MSDNHLKTYATSHVLRELQTQILIAKNHIYVKYKVMLKMWSYWNSRMFVEKMQTDKNNLRDSLVLIPFLGI